MRTALIFLAAGVVAIRPRRGLEDRWTVQHMRFPSLDEGEITLSLTLSMVIRVLNMQFSLSLSNMLSLSLNERCVLSLFLSDVRCFFFLSNVPFFFSLLLQHAVLSLSVQHALSLSLNVRCSLSLSLRPAMFFFLSLSNVRCFFSLSLSSTCRSLSLSNVRCCLPLSLSLNVRCFLSLFFDRRRTCSSLRARVTVHRTGRLLLLR